MAKINLLGVLKAPMKFHFLVTTAKIAASGFDPPTSGLWAQHASTAPRCFIACEDIPTTESGNVMYVQANLAAKHAPGTTALMLCKFGYVNSFPSLVFCRENGQWNTELGHSSFISHLNYSV
uniref:Sushi domain-containing protein n=1 Tax=Elaeophora elaphi TaxID=1147741 RepID=A0A0R3RQH6_9BILA